MKPEMRENVKVGLLGVIALTLIVNTYYASKRKGAYVAPMANSAAIATDPGIQAPTPVPNPVTNVNSGDPVTIGSSNMDPNQKTTRIAFGEYSHDFGTIKQNSTNVYKFKFTNTGDEPLLISNAVGSCGCTVPNYPKEPIAPGKTATIDVEYKPGLQKGNQEKKVTITANTDPAQTILTIKANVLEE